MEQKRHTLLDISLKGRQAIVESMEVPLGVPADLAKQLVLEGVDGVLIPGILRRQDTNHQPESVAVGFSSPFRFQNSRIRLPAVVPVEEVIEMISPYDVLERRFNLRTPALQALQELRNRAESVRLRLGVWGSAGLEVYTTLPYTDACSDLDLLVEPSTLEKLKDFHSLSIELANIYGCKIDMELDLGDYQVKVSELLGESTLILSKGVDGVDLRPREEVVRFISK